MKKIYLILISLFIIFTFYILGILTHKFKIPPYKQIKMVYKKFYSYPKLAAEYQISEKKLEEYINKRENLVNIDPKKKIVKYSIGMNIWIDRYYFDIINNIKIDDLFLIQQKRHNTNDIVINSKKKMNIIRVLCSINDNSNYADWKKISYNFLIIGGTCIHDEAVMKEFEAGSIIIPSGGPIASDPIFIFNLNNLDDVKITMK